MKSSVNGLHSRMEERINELEYKQQKLPNLSNIEEID